MPIESENITSLLRQAKQQIDNQINKAEPLLFDPQGRVLVDVPSSPEHLGPTTVSFDMSICELSKIEDSSFYSKINETLGIHTTLDHKEKLAICNALHSSPKGSIIPLQQEFHFHLALSSRVYEKIIKNKGGSSFVNDNNALPDNITQAHQETMKEVNQLVMISYAQALKGAMRKGVLNIATLNRALDKARLSIAPEAHRILMRKIVQYTGQILTKDDLKKAKKTAEETTASPNDVLHIDRDLESATLIKGSNVTAHHRAENDSSDRRLTTYSLNKEGRVTNSLPPRIQIRVPSLAKKDKIRKGGNERECITDVADQLASFKNKYQLGSSQHEQSSSVTDLGPDLEEDELSQPADAQESMPKVFVYNLFTALNAAAYDESKNRQTQSARRIVLGAHQYNKNQLNSERQGVHGEGVFCFVQNISVNGFGDTLGYDTNDPLREEMTLMSEMALLHTLYALEPEDDLITNLYMEFDGTRKTKQRMREVMDQYKIFLTTSKDDGHYFSATESGKQAIHLMKEIKSQLRCLIESGEETNIWKHANDALRNLMANDRHCTHDDAKLVQSLSVFLEKASLGGCKSANERAQMINGRVAIFDAVSRSPEDERYAGIRGALSELARAPSGTVAKSARRLNTELNTLYNQLNLQGAASMVSLLDQGASAKVEAKPWYAKILPKVFLSTNFAEESDQVITNMSQTKAGKMQAHKNLSTFMKNAWEGNPISFWDRMSSSPLKKVGAVLGVLFFPVALFVGVLGIVENNKKKAQTRNELRTLPQSEKPSEKKPAGTYDSSHTLLHALGGPANVTEKPAAKPKHQEEMREQQVQERMAGQEQKQSPTVGNRR
jgi:hypothetical protein